MKGVGTRDALFCSQVSFHYVTFSLVLSSIKRRYWNLPATNKISSGEQANAVNSRRGVKQGCILSSIIFILYSEGIFRKALQNIETGIVLNGERVNHIHYADSVIFAVGMNSLQELIYRIKDVISQYEVEGTT